MKRPPFDDPRSFTRRWSRLTPREFREESHRDPLLFVADHLSILDRRAGAIAIHAEVGHDLPPALILISDGPVAPREEDCLGLLATVVANLQASVEEMEFDIPEGECAVRRLGVVTHRVGTRAVHDIDRRWMRALALLSAALGIEALGVLVRIRSGDLVRVPLTEAA